MPDTDQTTPAERRCCHCDATTGLRLLPTLLGPREWECADGCPVPLDTENAGAPGMSNFTTATIPHALNRRWWVLRGPRGALTLTAVAIPVDVPPLSTAIVCPDGVRLMPDCLEFHRPGNDHDCPALDGRCDGGSGALTGAGDLLADWAESGRDDSVIWDALTVKYSWAAAVAS